MDSIDTQRSSKYHLLRTSKCFLIVIFHLKVHEFSKNILQIFKNIHIKKICDFDLQTESVRFFFGHFVIIPPTIPSIDN